MRLVVIAPKGKMGRCIIKAAHEDPRLTMVGAVGPKGRSYIGDDAGLVARVGVALNAPVSDDLESIVGTCDVIVDFSTPQVSMHVLDVAVRHGKALVCGTTGFTPVQREEFDRAAATIPLVFAANTSRLVNYMNKLLEICARAFGEEADIEIIEMHDQNKADTPSGTSLEMGAIMAEAMGKEIKDLAVYGRGAGEPRKPGSIGYHSVRAGSLPSSHVVFFGCTGERLEIAHHTYDWDCLGIGACDAALFLQGKKPGLYTVKDVLGLD